MSATTAVPNDIASRHVLVVTEAFMGRLAAGSQFQIAVPKGTVLAAASLGQTNVHAGMGPRHPKAVLIEHETANPGDVLPDAEVAAGVAAAAAKQALVPAQRAAREVQAQAARTAAAAEQAAIPKRLAAIEAHLGIKTPG